MKPESQHLEFLVSQYVDGCLEGASRKTVEQKLLHDPSARAIYGEQRETQDLLDDWGNRIPLIDWDDFDRTLATRLEKEAFDGRRARAIKRWIKPAAVAASLLLAAGMGYAWHGMSGQLAVNAGNGTSPIAGGPRRNVQFPEMQRQARPNKSQLIVEEPGGTALAGNPNVEQLAVEAPSNNAVPDAVRESVLLGTPKVKNDVAIAPGVVGASAAPANSNEHPPVYP